MDCISSYGQLKIDFVGKSNDRTVIKGAQPVKIDNIDGICAKD